LDAMPDAPGKRLAILGDMKELGKFSEQAHKEVGTYALKKVDYLICIGNEFVPLANMWKQNGRPVEYFEENNDALHALKSVAQPGDVVLLKGSHSCRLWELLEAF